MSLLCLKCTLPDCDDESPACLIRLGDSATRAHKTTPLMAAIRYVQSDSRCQGRRACACVLGQLREES